MKKITALLIAGAMLGSLAVFAGDAPKPEKKRRGLRAMLVKYDADKNGKLDASERKAMLEAETKNAEERYQKMQEAAKKRHDRELARLKALDQKLEKCDGDLKQCCKRARRGGKKGGKALPAEKE